MQKNFVVNKVCLKKIVILSHRAHAQEQMGKENTNMHWKWGITKFSFIESNSNLILKYIFNYTWLDIKLNAVHKYILSIPIL